MAYRCEGKCFTFTWKLQNISFCSLKAGECIISPAFVVHTIDHTKWNLLLYPRGRITEGGYYIACFLKRRADSEGAEKVGVKYEIAFISKNESVLTSNIAAQYDFPKNIGNGFPKLEIRENVFISRRSEFLSEDTLKVRCRMWKSVGEMTENVRCTALTCVGVEKGSFVWNVKNFSTLGLEKKCTYHIKSKENDGLLMYVDLSLIGRLNSDEIISFELSLQDPTIKFSTLRLLLIDTSGKRVECNKETIWFDDPAECKHLTFRFTKKKLLEEKKRYLPQDTLSLLWEWAFTRKIISEEIEEDEFGCIWPEIKNSDAQNANNAKANPLKVLVNNVETLYNEQFLSDVQVKTNTSVFPAHKFILSASSSVFKAMFSNDMKENDMNCVNIEDFSDDTINGMLLFIYTAHVEDLTWKDASSLYVAADKYAIMGLRDVCSSYMKDNLTPSNACEALILSDFHADDELKSVVQDYVLRNGKRVTKSEKWKGLMETNSKLAAETLCLLFK